MTEGVATLLGQISVETARLQGLLPYATEAMRKISRGLLESQRDIVDPQRLQWLAVDEESTALNQEEKSQLKSWRTAWTALAQEHLKALRMASDSIWQQFQWMQQVQDDMLRKFLEFLREER